MLLIYLNTRDVIQESVVLTLLVPNVFNQIPSHLMMNREYELPNFMPTSLRHAFCQSLCRFDFFL